MPTLLFWKGWRFIFYSVDLGEPPHVHAYKDGKELKVWLQDGTMARSKRCTPRERNQLLKVVAEHREMFLEAWHEHGRD